ncbi:MAG: class D sortase [Paraclostridium sp.]
MKRIIGKLLILVGILTIGSVVYINYRTVKINQAFVNEYKENTKNLEGRKDEYKTGDVIGVLNIPKINLEVAIKRGITDEILKDSVGHFENTPMPYENGNFSVAGHRTYTSNKFFSNLDEVEMGDELIVLFENETYKYIVDSIEVVTPDKVEVIDSMDKDKREIILVTCTPKYVGSHRLIVKGTIVE